MRRGVANRLPSGELGRLRWLIALELRMPEGRENCAPMIRGTERGTRRGRTRDRLSLIFADQFCLGAGGSSRRSQQGLRRSAGFRFGGFITSVLDGYGLRGQLPARPTP